MAKQYHSIRSQFKWMFEDGYRITYIDPQHDDIVIYVLEKTTRFSFMPDELHVAVNSLARRNVILMVCDLLNEVTEDNCINDIMEQELHDTKALELDY